MSGEKSALVSLVILAASAVVGILVGGVVWTAVTDAVVQADNDGLDLTLAMFDGRSVGAGVVAAIVAALVSVELLDFFFRKIGR